LEEQFAQDPAGQSPGEKLAWTPPLEESRIKNGNPGYKGIHANVRLFEELGEG
jgi:hypothetical protein